MIVCGAACQPACPLRPRGGNRALARRTSVDDGADAKEQAVHSPLWASATLSKWVSSHCYLRTGFCSGSTVAAAWSAGRLSDAWSRAIRSAADGLCSPEAKRATTTDAFRRCLLSDWRGHIAARSLFFLFLLRFAFGPFARILVCRLPLTALLRHRSFLLLLLFIVLPPCRFSLLLTLPHLLAYTCSYKHFLPSLPLAPGYSLRFVGRFKLTPPSLERGEGETEGKACSVPGA